MDKLQDVEQLTSSLRTRATAWGVSKWALVKVATYVNFEEIG